MDRHEFTFHEVSGTAEKTYVVQHKYAPQCKCSVGMVTHSDLSGSWILVHAAGGTAEIEHIDEKTQAPIRDMMFQEVRRILTKAIG